MANPVVMNLTDIISFQETNKRSRTSNWTDLASKKALRESNLLEDEQYAVVEQLKGTFSFSLHTSKQWLVVTLYNSRDKKYRFIVINLTNMTAVTMDTIKESKKWVEEQITSVSQPVEDAIVENVTEEQVTEVEDTKTTDKAKRNRRTK